MTNIWYLLIPILLLCVPAISAHRLRQYGKLKWLAIWVVLCFSLAAYSLEREHLLVATYTLTYVGLMAVLQQRSGKPRAQWQLSDLLFTMTWLTLVTAELQGALFMRNPLGSFRMPPVAALSVVMVGTLSACYVQSLKKRRIDMLVVTAGIAGIAFYVDRPEFLPTTPEVYYVKRNLAPIAKFFTVAFFVSTAVEALWLWLRSTVSKAQAKTLDHSETTGEAAACQACSTSEHALDAAVD